MASYKSAFRPQARTISPLLILVAALLLGMFVYGFTASATLNSDANLAGGRGNAVGIAFTLNSNSVDYGFTGTTAGSLDISSVTFNVYVTSPATFSSGVRVFSKVNTDSGAPYSLCSAVTGQVTNVLQVTTCSVATTSMTSVNFGLDVVVIE